jgi:hypothetical protein
MQICEKVDAVRFALMSQEEVVKDLPKHPSGNDILGVSTGYSSGSESCALAPAVNTVHNFTNNGAVCAGVNLPSHKRAQVFDVHRVWNRYGMIDSKFSLELHVQAMASIELARN